MPQEVKVKMLSPELPTTPLKPIGIFHCTARYPYDAARQPVIAASGDGYVLLEKGCNYEQALQDLGGFSHIWLIYLFHHNPNWKPMIRPPRAPGKVGVFASRAPHRPNPLGISCVELVSIQGLRVNIGPHDLLDGTPILDIKPYLPYADSIPHATCGWVEEVDENPWEVRFTPEALKRLDWLERAGVKSIRAFLLQQLREQPFNQQLKRIRQIDDTHWEIAYRTWRINYSAKETEQQIVVKGIHSAYTDDDLLTADDKYNDKTQHREFRNTFQK